MKPSQLYIEPSQGVLTAPRVPEGARQSKSKMKHTSRGAWSSEKRVGRVSRQHVAVPTRTLRAWKRGGFLALGCGKARARHGRCRLEPGGREQRPAYHTPSGCRRESYPSLGGVAVRGRLEPLGTTAQTSSVAA